MLREQTDIILNNAVCLGDKIKAHELVISALTLNRKPQEAWQHCKSVLNSLGFSFPSEDVTTVLKELKSKAVSITPDQLRSLPLMNDEISLQAMKIMSTIHPHSSFSFPTSFQQLSCQMMMLTLKNGLCIESAEAFANFGYCLDLAFRDYDAGYRMGKLALVILEHFKPTSRAKVGKVYFLVYGLLSIWKEPIHAAAEGLKSSIKIGLVEGDYTNVLYNQACLNRQLILCGEDLSEVRDRLIRLCRSMVRFFAHLRYHHSS